MPPPPPVAKPGRVQVYHALVDYIPKQEDELQIQEGDVLYVKEATDTARDTEKAYYEVIRGDQRGKVPKDFVDSSTNVLKIDFPLHEAARRGNLEFLEECLQNNVSVNCLDKSGSTALYWASHGGHLQAVQLLLSVAKICVSSQNKMGDTPLHAACYKGRLDCAAALVEAGADLYAKNKDLKKAVDLASTPEIAAFLRLAMSKVVEPTEDEEAYDDGDESSDNENAE
ncbi:ankyrin repeats (many copies) domain-containing protein [Ditylenchus destructor]|uniref:Osteoclast-stimulating factor 1 n=1 Tax=Ditylenchus destructor TaxID=166010 RepID=A0AAD4R5Q9_9BILA|nr:ankyrin repeats (many copies) domain-containing protein [Ditylenchus destructor]